MRIEIAPEGVAGKRKEVFEKSGEDFSRPMHISDN